MTNPQREPEEEPLPLAAIRLHLEHSTTLLAQLTLHRICDIHGTPVWLPPAAHRLIQTQIDANEALIAALNTDRVANVVYQAEQILNAQCPEFPGDR